MAFPELLNGAKLNQALRLNDGTNDIDCRVEHGYQSVTMADDPHTLVLGGAGAAQTRLVNNIIIVDPGSGGAGENLTMPAAADWRGPYTFYNEGDEDVYLLDASANAIHTLQPGRLVTLRNVGGLVMVEAIPEEGADFNWFAPGAAHTFYVAKQPMTVNRVRYRVDVAGTDAGAVTGVIYKVPSGTAPASGSAIHTSTINLKGTANTLVTMTPHGTAANLQLDAGDALIFVPTGTTTAAIGGISVGLLPR